MSSTPKSKATDEEALRALRESKMHATYGARLHDLSRRAKGVLKKQATKDYSQPKKLDAPLESEYGPGSHSWWYSMIRAHSHRSHAAAYQRLVAILISVSVINFVLETEVVFQKYCSAYFNVFEAALSILFAAEYFLKVGTSPERRVYADVSRDVARFKWLFTSEAVIDFASWAPFFIELLCGLNADKSEVLRMIRLIRVLKLPVVWRSFRLVSRVVYYNYEILGSSIMVCFTMMLLCSVLLFYTKPAMPEFYDPLNNWSSVLACMYIAILMLTGQGEPDGVMPWYTRIVIAITALFAIAQFAIPASMLTWGFEQEAEHNILKQNEREKKAAKRQAEGKEILESSSSSDASDRQSEWDGYLEQVLGSEFEGSESSDSPDKKDAPAMKQQLPAKPSSAAQLLLTAAASGEDHLTKEERRRAKAIFIRLDTDNDDRLDWRKVRALTETDKQAEDLIQQLCAFQEITGDKSVTMREFFTWLGSVKTNHTRYGDKVLLRLLNHMEYMLFGPGSQQRSRKATRSTIKASDLMRRADLVVAARGPVERTAVVAPAAGSQQLLQIASGFDDLERENTELENKILELEKELAALKAAA